MKMQKEWTLIDEIPLDLLLDYDYLTAGDLGNILIRLQACVRSLSGLARKRRLDYLQGEPHFVVKAFTSKSSAEFWLAVAALGYSVALQPLWSEFARLAWKRLIAAVYFAIKGELPQHKSLRSLPEEAEVKLTKGYEENLRMEVNLSELDPDQAEKLAHFIGSIIYPTKYAYLRDEKNELFISRRQRPGKTTNNADR